MADKVEQVELDGLFMQAVSSSKSGIDGFFFSLFGFLRRKTDFFQMDNKCMEIITKNYQEQVILWKEDRERQAALTKKKEQEKALAKAKEEEERRKKEGESPVKNSGETQATCEEVTDEEAERIMREEAERKARLERGEEEEPKKDEKKEEKKDEDKAEGEDGEKKSNKAQPNSGNGGSTEKYDWIQTLDDLTVFIKVPDRIKANQLEIKYTNTKLRVAVKGQPPILEGEWHKKIKCEDSMWSLESDGDKRLVQINIQKFEGQYWWHCVLVGEPEIDTQKVEPESSKLSDLDLETRAAVEKMMFDQNQKMKGLPTSEEMSKRDKLKDFMAAHPEMDFSKCKFM